MRRRPAGAVSACLFGAVAFFAVLCQGPAKAGDPPKLTAHHVAISVADVDSLAKWYVEKLGFHLAKRFAVDDGKVQIAWLDIGSFRIGMMQAAGSKRAAQQKLKPPGDNAFQGYKTIVYAVADVDDAYRRLVAEGVTGVLPPATSNPPDIRIAYISDPEGNIIGLYRDIDPANAITANGTAR